MDFAGHVRDRLPAPPIGPGARRKPPAPRSPPFLFFPHGPGGPPILRNQRHSQEAGHYRPMRGARPGALMALLRAPGAPYARKRSLSRPRPAPAPSSARKPRFSPPISPCCATFLSPRAAGAPPAGQNTARAPASTFPLSGCSCARLCVQAMAMGGWRTAWRVPGGAGGAAGEGGRRWNCCSLQKFRMTSVPLEMKRQGENEEGGIKKRRRKAEERKNAP